MATLIAQVQTVLAQEVIVTQMAVIALGTGRRAIATIIVLPILLHLGVTLQAEAIAAAEVVVAAVEAAVVVLVVQDNINMRLTNDGLAKMYFVRLFLVN